MADANKLAPIIIIKKKKAAGHGHHGGAWKVAYADFVTAMMAFFLVMWLMGADEETLKSIEKYFTQSGSQVQLESRKPSDLAGDKVNVFDKAPTAGGRDMDMPAGKVNAATTSDEQLQHLYDLLEESFSLDLGMTSLAQDLKLAQEPEGRVLRIAIKGMFREGDTEITPDYLPVVHKLGQVLASTSWRIRIEGHTDPNEKVETYESRWELSAARATRVARYWTNSSIQIDPRRLKIEASGGNSPIASSETEAGRAANRRVEIVVLSQKMDSAP